MDAIIRAFSRYADDYDRWFDAHRDEYAEQIDLLRRYLPPDTGEMLETGTGSGRFASQLGIQHGIDPSFRLVAVAKERGLETVIGAGEFLPYRDRTFDGVLMMTVICFMDDIARSFEEAFRVLRPGGILVVAFLEKGEGIALREEGSDSRFFQYARFFSAPGVTEALAGAGFSRVMIRERCRGLCVVTATKDR